MIDPEDVINSLVNNNKNIVKVKIKKSERKNSLKSTIEKTCQGLLEEEELTNDQIRLLIDLLPYTKQE